MRKVFTTLAVLFTAGTAFATAPSVDLYGGGANAR